MSPGRVGGLPVMRRLRLAATTLALVAIVGMRAEAHPLATTTVSMSYDTRDRLTMSISADADALIAKLEALAGDAAAKASSAHDCRVRLRDLVPTFISHVDVRVDGTPVIPALDSIEVDGTRQAAIVLHATMPPDAKRVTWRSSFVFGSYPLAMRSADGHEVVQWLQGPETSAPMAIATTSGQPSFMRGLGMGFTHIVPAGIDHILFVVGLFLLSRRPREVFLQVTAFTIAHSVTLGLCLYGLVSAPPSIVEPMIALSVAYVGVENLMTSRLHPWRLAVVFAFGLLHGMGFAEALAGLHLSAAGFLTTLVSFNAGVELGQLAVIACASAILAIITFVRATASAPATRLASAAIGVVGVFWMIERIYAAP